MYTLKSSKFPPGVLTGLTEELYLLHRHHPRLLRRPGQLFHRPGLPLHHHSVGAINQLLGNRRRGYYLLRLSPGPLLLGSGCGHFRVRSRDGPSPCERPHHWRQRRRCQQRRSAERRPLCTGWRDLLWPQQCCRGISRQRAASICRDWPAGLVGDVHQVCSDLGPPTLDIPVLITSPVEFRQLSLTATASKPRPGTARFTAIWRATPSSLHSFTP